MIKPSCFKHKKNTHFQKRNFAINYIKRKSQYIRFNTNDYTMMLCYYDKMIKYCVDTIQFTMLVRK